MSRHRVELTEKAVALAAVITDWWHANRLGAPGLFESELRSTIDLIADRPGIGQKYEEGGPNVRRAFMRRTKHHLYYELDQNGVVWVLAVWHAGRGHGPPLA